MRVLIVHHGPLPPGPEEADRPVSGGALRAGWHARALSAAGHEVRCLSRAADSAGGFDGHADLLRIAAGWRPDRLVVVQPEDAAALSPLDVPMAVDLYAPRLLEASFEGTLTREARTTLEALATGDIFLMSNPRQRFMWLGVMALAGLDLRVDPSRLVPLVVEPGPARQIPASPVFIGGGASWAWQDPRDALSRAVAHLDRRALGTIHWVGGTPLLAGQEAGRWRLPEHPRLIQHDWMGRRAFWAHCATATAAFDIMAPNAERSLAFAFRHTDYLGCGLPILTGADSALVDVLGGAGWAGDAVEAMLDFVIDHPEGVATASEAASKLGKERFGLESCEAPLLRWVAEGSRAHRQQSLITAGALAHEADRQQVRAEALGQALRKSASEIQQKRKELLRLTRQIHVLLRTNDRLSRAIDEVAGFKREAVAVLGGEVERERLDATAANTELAICRADLAKKNAELFAAQELATRLENDLRAAHAEIERQRHRGLFGRS